MSKTTKLWRLIRLWFVIVTASVCLMPTSEWFHYRSIVHMWMCAYLALPGCSKGTLLRLDIKRHWFYNTSRMDDFCPTCILQIMNKRSLCVSMNRSHLYCSYFCELMAFCFPYNSPHNFIIKWLESLRLSFLFYFIFSFTRAGISPEQSRSGNNECRSDSHYGGLDLNVGLLQSN